MVSLLCILNKKKKDKKKKFSGHAMGKQTLARRGETKHGDGWIIRVLIVALVGNV